MSKDEKAEEEVKAYYEVKYSKKDEGLCYLIELEWYIKWKQYVNLKYYKSKLGIHRSNKKTKESPKNNDKLAFSGHPGKIDNTKLLVDKCHFWIEDDLTNKENMVLNRKVGNKRINSGQWNFFLTKYKGGPEVSFEFSKDKSNQSLYQSNLYPIIFLPKKKEIIGNDNKIIHFFDDHNSMKFLPFFSNKLISQLKEKILYLDNLKNKRKLKPSSVRLWKVTRYSFFPPFFLANFGKKAVEMDNTLKEKPIEINMDYIYYLESKKEPIDKHSFPEDNVIIIEIGDNPEDFYFEMSKKETKEGKCAKCLEHDTLRVHCACKLKWYCCADCKDMDMKEHMKNCKVNCIEEDQLIRTSKSRLGVVGLSNLGNTCFMNTSLQCMSNCWEFTNYFLMDFYKNDLNLTNPIGSKGILAKSYANIIRHLWNGEKFYYFPDNFKLALEQYQTIFEGNGQQDTQEFLSYLMDGLHEDLNRVKSKSYIKEDDIKKPDIIKSQMQWYQFQQRNQSIVFDLFYGQFKSSINCPNVKCRNLSSTFEPFLTLSLPLVNHVFPFEITCFFIFYDLNCKPIKYTLQFASDCCVMALRNKIAIMLHIHPFSFLIAKMTHGGNLAYFVNSNQLLSLYIDTNTTSNDYPYFLLQYNPNVFYNPKNNINLLKENKSADDYDLTGRYEVKNEVLKKLFNDDYEEDESGIPEDNSSSYYQIDDPAFGKVEIENRHGFTADNLTVLLYFAYYTTIPGTKDKKIKINEHLNILFPRIVTLKKDTSCKEIHHIVFNLIKPAFNDLKDKAFNVVFPEIDTENDNDTLEFQASNNYPYRLRIINIMIKQDKCLICSKKNCYNCLLPYDEITLGSLIEKYPKNNGKLIDNTYFFLSENQKTLLRNSNNSNKDFTLQMTIFKKREDTLNNRLNDFKNYEMKLTKSDLKKKIEIDRCFNYFMKWEKLGDTNEYFCTNCKSQQQAKKKMELFKCPHFLIIHLKKFKKNSKYDTFVNFPVEGLDMKKHVISNEEGYPLLYDLYAVANHIGDASSGHYYACCKNPIRNEWYKYEDSNVTKINKSEIVSSNAYVLFYRRRNLENILDLMNLYNGNFVNHEFALPHLEDDIKIINETLKMDYEAKHH